MQNIEPQQGVFADDISAEGHEPHFSSNDRHRRDDVRADGDRPESQLVPRQQISGVAQEKRDQQQEYPNHPVELMGRLVSAAVEYVEHVPENEQHHQMRTQAMHIAEEDAVGNNEAQIFHVVVGVGHRRVVIEHQQDTGDHENDEQQQ